MVLYSDAAPEWQPVIRPEDGTPEADVTLTVPTRNRIIRFLGYGLPSRR